MRCALLPSAWLRARSSSSDAAIAADEWLSSETCAGCGTTVGTTTGNLGKVYSMPSSSQRRLMQLSSQVFCGRNTPGLDQCRLCVATQKLTASGRSRRREERGGREKGEKNESQKTAFRLEAHRTEQRISPTGESDLRTKADFSHLVAYWRFDPMRPADPTRRASRRR